MQAKGGPDRKKATYLAAGAELRSHFLQVGVAESVAVVCVENFFLGDMLAHGPKTLPDIAPDARIDHGDAPVLFGIAEDLHFLSKAENDAVGVHRQELPSPGSRLPRPDRRASCSTRYPSH